MDLNEPGAFLDYTENIQPIPQGRKINALLRALPLVDNAKARQQLLQERKDQFESDLKANCDDLSKQLDLWYEYIDWLEQNVPDGGKVNGITNAIESCIELYCNKKQFKQDKRLFNIFMKFKRFCDEPIEVFGFMYANSIATLLAKFYLNWSWHYEIRKNMNRAEDLIKLGLKNLASPRDVLVEAQSQLKCRIESMVRAGDTDDCPDFSENGRLSDETLQRLDGGADIRGALQTLKFRVNKKKNISRVPINRVGQAVDRVNVGGLKSQTTVVNGVRVPKKPVASSKLSAKSNGPIQIFVDGTGDDSVVAQSTNEVPTSQQIKTIGRPGAENSTMGRTLKVLSQRRPL